MAQLSSEKRKAVISQFFTFFICCCCPYCYCCVELCLFVCVFCYEVSFRLQLCQFDGRFCRLWTNRVNSLHWISFKLAIYIVVYCAVVFSSLRIYALHDRSFHLIDRISPFGHWPNKSFVGENESIQWRIYRCHN